MFSKSTDGKTFMVCGPVSRDAEYRQVGDKNSSLTTFSVKCDERTEADGTVTPIWTNCECWHSVARLARAIKKADTVFAIGTIKTETWTDKQTGEQKSGKKLVCDFVAITPYSANPAPAAPAAPPAQTYPAAPSSAQVQAAADDYPF